jgi:15-cis-phytoene synthase
VTVAPHAVVLPALRPQPGIAAARDTTRRVATTFALACRLLPAAVRDDVYLLYLLFRTLDDLVDDGMSEAGARVDAVAAWADGDPAPSTPEVALLDELSGRHPLPRRAIGEFCAGMRQDLAAERFATEAELDRYCYRVAGTVGVVMTSLLGARDPGRAWPAAAALGMAMQRTNILRDIDEDAAAGRVYLAQETIAELGPPLPGRRAALVRDGIARADALYGEGLAGVAQLRRGRRAVAAAGAMYREILREIERRGLDAQGRAVVPKGRRASIGLRAAAYA